MSNRNLRRRQTLLSLLAFLPLVAALVLGILFSYRAADRREYNHAQALALSREGQVHLWAEEVIRSQALVQAVQPSASAVPPLETWFTLLQETRPHLQGLALVDPDGARPQETAGAFSISQAERKVRLPGETPPQMGPFLALASTEEGAPALLILAPTDDGRVLAVQVAPESLQNALVNNQAAMSTGPFRTYLVAPGGGVIPLDGQTPAGPAWMEWLPPEEGQAVTVDPEGRSALGAVRWLPGKQAGVLVVAPRAELITRTERLSNFLWAGLFVLALLGVVGLWRLGNQVVEGLEQLQHAVRRAPQDFSLDDALDGPLELAEVAQGFQEMAQKVVHMQKNLVEQVRARTAALEASEERYRLLAELSPIPIGLHDQEKVLYVNEAAARLFRAPSAADLIGRALHDFLHPEEIERARQILACLLEHRPPPEPGRYRMRRWDGTEFLAELTVALLHTEAEPLFQIILRPISGDQASAAIQQVFSRLAQDILAGRALEEQIWDLYEGCRRILPLDTFYLAIVDQENQTYTTPLFIQRGENLGAFTRPLAAESLTAYVVRTRQPLLIRDSSDPDQLPATPQRIAFPPEKLCYMAVPLLHREEVLGVLSAQNFTVNAYGEEDFALLAELGNQIALALVHARQMQAIRTQATRMQRILDTAPGGLLMLDGAHRVALANPDAWKLLEQLGAFSEEGRLTHLAGQPLEELLPQATAAGAPITLEQQEPAHLVVEVASRPLSLLDGDEGWIVSLHDVTRLREQERRLQRQERLATVGQLAAGMAHDFNNILAVITLYSQMLLANPDAPKRKQYLASIYNQSEYAARLIAQILDFSRRAVIERTHFDLVRLAAETVELLQRTLPENIMLILETQMREVSVHADRGRIQQAMMNLVVNARDAMPEGGRIWIRLDALEVVEGAPLPREAGRANLAPGMWVRLQVVDTGPGIPSEHLSQIFNPFFTTKPPGQGTGLGLAQVYGIVKQHGGDVQVDSPPGRGATFTLYLPVAEADPET